MPRPIGIDLFAGAGGLSLGFEQAGFDIAAAVEYDPVHAGVHAFNFPETVVLPRSVLGLSSTEIRQRAGIGDATVDVVFGGAPCQGFSLIGHRALDDPRNALVPEFVRLVDALQARYFVFENVKGLTVGRHKRFLEELIGAFQEKGYQVRLPWKVLNAADFGVPQDRERLFLMGAREGQTLPTYPHPTTRPAGTSGGLITLPCGPSCADALSDLPDADTFPALLTSDNTRIRRSEASSPYARELQCIDDAGWHFQYARQWDPDVLTSSLRTDHSDISRRRFASTACGSTEPISRFYRLPAQGVSNTLRAGTDSARGAFTSPRPIHYEYARCITVREMARLHGFPDWFRFHETKWHGARQIGNSVPPPLARVIARAIMEALGMTPERPARVQPLGDPRLLRMTMSEAARHFDQAVLIGKRDRKSGAHKRKQGEIEGMEMAGFQREAHGG